MKDETFAAISIVATIAFGIAAMLGLLAAALVLGSGTSVVLALLSIGASYVSQTVGTFGVYNPKLEKPALALQLLAMALWLAGLGLLFSGA